MVITLDKNRPKIYCKCNQCDDYFEITISKRPSFYCSKQCNDKAYYNKKK